MSHDVRPDDVEIVVTLVITPLVTSPHTQGSHKLGVK